MEIVWKIVYTFLVSGLELFIFFKVDGIGLTFERIFKAFLFKILLAFVFVTINYIVGNDYLSYFTEPLYGIGLSFLLFRGLPKKLLIFYGLFPMILVNLFYRGVSYFLLPFLEQGQLYNDYSFTWLCIIIFNFFISLAFLRWLDYDFTSLRRESIDKDFQKSLTTINWIMGAYFLVMETLSFFEYEQVIQSKTVRHFILVFYLLFFMGIVKKLDTYLKDKLHERLDKEKALRYRDMERYSRHIEELYKEVRSFRHDYTNLLTSLRLGIEEEDMEQIKEVYDSVLKDSSEKLQDNKYDLGRLVNIRDRALKSLLAGKFLKARDKKIVFNVEVPEEIQVEGMSLLDFLTIVSILCDNAIEASVEASQPHVSIAFLKNGEQETFIIENSIKEEGIDISEIFSFGASSKGEERGVGLYTVMKIVESHPNTSLNTTCQNQVFRQVLTVHSMSVDN
ncbi:ATP-binding protein [Streptococcus mitis]|uniref:BlpH histidine kinase TCS13 n=1 Tax=Streptococcus mitis TaxID=28037 RepID=A0AAX2LHQ5_STRMT|nr:sensor histidine kinase [Streptococcus mitis]MBZ2104046.1 sensor histidine kinase [Streptococcus mitis]OOS16314.1 ATP-binding protein [Streptococcus mitis]QBZ11190.1 histidine kinase-, DNA gyrase B-, and HSP90-like ATPase family protein [Streptococcus mitis NCTC 12261]QGS41741.1 GHKL domain-containing protein [Streptococcus mitis]QXA54392.1 sensor histidine kinase [Streptococcus mitis]